MTHPALPFTALLALLAGCSAQTEEAERPAVTDQAPADAAAQPQPQPQSAPAAGNQPATASPAQPARSNDPRLAVDPEGLRWFLPENGSSRALSFGMAEADVLASLERVRGPAGKGINADCGAGPVRYANWPDGLSLVFQNGRFAGWGLDGRAANAIATADGIGIGTTRTQLDEAIGPPLVVRKTSLGTEFSAGSYFGLFDGAGPNARITDMWAGVSCVAR